MLKIYFSSTNPIYFNFFDDLNGHLFSKELRSLKVCLDNEKSMIVEVGDDGLVVGREADASGRVEVFPHRTLESVLVQEVAVGSKQLKRIIASIIYLQGLKTGLLKRTEKTSKQACLFISITKENLNVCI
jgi:hypothetical protein